ncbi:alkaline phosphatase, partial [bacterium]|nr:alkaline phosphatase [bacterium]
MKRLSMVILTVALACNVAYAQCGMKNVIIMVADGWGYNQVLAAECFNGARQVYEEFPIRLAMSTYSYDGWGYDSAQAWADFLYVMLGWTDSASSATAMSTGVKIHDGQINVDPVTEAALFTTLQQAEELGKVTGVVTSVPLSHATPAGWTAHDTYRGNYSAIAVEMIDSSNCEVVMGCGHPLYNNDCTLDGNVTESDYDYVGGSAKWAQLVAGMAGQASGHPYPWTLIDNKLDFVDLATDPNPPPRVIGVPRARTTLQQARPTVIGEGGNGTALPYSAARNNCVPTLAEMSRAALNVLRHADDMNNGIFLMIEG